MSLVTRGKVGDRFRVTCLVRGGDTVGEMVSLEELVTLVTPLTGL